MLSIEHSHGLALNTPADIYIINRENVCWLVDHYRNSSLAPIQEIYLRP